MNPVPNTVISLVLTVLLTVRCTHYLFAEHGPHVRHEAHDTDVHQRRSGNVTTPTPETMLPVEAEDSTSDWVSVSSTNTLLSTPASAPDESPPPRGPLQARHTAFAFTNQSRRELVLRNRAI